MERKKLVLGMAGSVIFLIVIFLPKFSELQKLREENGEINKRIEFIRENNDLLKEEIRKMREEPGYIEKKAREKLGIVKKGEYIYEGLR